MTMPLDFSSMISSAAAGEVLIPVIHRLLLDPDFEGFQMQVEPWSGRGYDGWFHPSTHSTLTLRQLYLYLTRPELLREEHMPLSGVMAVTSGHFWHNFIQMLLLKDGVMLKDEVPVRDRITRRTGHVDGLLRNGEALEIKCMVPSTLLEMEDGTRRSASDVRTGDRVIGWNERLSFSTPMTVLDQWDNGVRPTYAVETKEGKQVVVTGNHPFLTQRGWIWADELTSADFVRVESTVPPWADDLKCQDPEEAHALGVLVGDGGLTGQVMYLTSADLDVVERMKQYALNQGAELVRATAKYIYRFRVPRQQARTIGNPILTRLREQGLAGCSSYTKRVPPVVWQGGPEAWRQFLSGYFDADGTVVTERTGSYPYLSWGSVNKDLLLDCQILLARLGIRSSVVSHIGWYKDRVHQSWNLMVRDRVSVARAQSSLDLWCGRKREDLASLRPGVANPMRALAAKIGWDRVRLVTPAGEQQTIGIQVDGGTHLTNGIVTHNTINDFQIKTVTNEAILKEKKYSYWTQTQDYLDILGIDTMRYLLLAPSYPFPMVEFAVRADQAYQIRRRNEYLRAIELAEQYPDGSAAELKLSLTPVCCGPGSSESKKCFARLACPIGRMS